MRVAVCDASAVVAALIDSGPDGQWARDAFDGMELAAPSLLEFEVSNILRRQESAGAIGAEQAAQSHADLLSLRVERWPQEALGARVWELRANLTSYDGSYVAVAELLDAPLLTLDRRLGRAAGPRCPVRTP